MGMIHGTSIPKRNRSIAGLFGAAGLLLSGCDAGLSVLPPPPIAVGGAGGILYIDFCTKDGTERGVTLYRCSDDTPTAVLGSTVSGPFQILQAGQSLAVVKATGVGRGVAEIDLQVKSGETRRVVAPVEGREVDTVKLTLYCRTATGKALPMATDTRFKIGYGLLGGGIGLAASGLPLQLDAQGLTLSEWTKEGSPGEVKYRTSATAGMASLTAAKDPSLKFAIEVVDRSAINLTWRPDSMTIPAAGGVTLIKSKYDTAGRTLCDLPGGTFTAAVTTPTLCEIAHAPPSGIPMASEYSASATLLDGENPAFAVRGRAPGSCDIEIRDAGNVWITPVRVTVYSP